jgi:hypothetical protein
LIIAIDTDARNVIFDIDANTKHLQNPTFVLECRVLNSRDDIISVLHRRFDILIGKNLGIECT